MFLMVEHGVQRFTVPRAAAGEHLPRDQPQAVDVATPVERAALDLLGRHVGRRADRDAMHRQLLRLRRHGAGNAEVRE